MHSTLNNEQIIRQQRKIHDLEIKVIIEKNHFQIMAMAKKEGIDFHAYASARYPDIFSESSDEKITPEDQQRKIALLERSILMEKRQLSLMELAKQEGVGFDEFMCKRPVEIFL